MDLTGDGRLTVKTVTRKRDGRIIEEITESDVIDGVVQDGITTVIESREVKNGNLS